MHGIDTQRKRRVPQAGQLMAVVCAVAVAFGPLAERSARAAGPAPRRVLLLPAELHPGVPRYAASKIADLVASVFPLDDRVAWVGPGSLVAPAAPPVETKKARGARPPRAPAPRASASPLEAATKALEAARADARANRHAAAIKGFTKALQGFAANLGLLADFAPYREAVVERALAYLASGYTDNADEEFLRALALDPSLELPSGASEDARAAFDRVRASVATAGGALSVIAEPAGAEVTVDGRLVERAPAVFEGLPRGEHVVRITADGHEGGGQVVTLGDEALTVALSLTPARGGAPASSGEAREPTQAATPSTTPLGGDGGLGALLRDGTFGDAFDALAGPVAQANGLAAIAMVWARPRTSGRGVVMAALVWAPGEGLAQVAEAEVSEDLSGLQLAVLDLAEQATSAALRFPTDKRVAGTPPIFADSPAPPEPAPVVRAAPPEPAPAPAEAPREGTYGGGPRARSEEGPPPSLFAPPPEAPRARRPRPDLIDELPDDESPEEASTPFYASWWFWTLTVGALAGGTTAAVLATQGDGGPRTWRATVTW